MPGTVTLERTKLDAPNSRPNERLRFVCGHATHIDAPSHFKLEVDQINTMPVTPFLAFCAIIDVSEKCVQDPNYELTVEDI